MQSILLALVVVLRNPFQEIGARNPTVEQHPKVKILKEKSQKLLLFKWLKGAREDK